MIQFMRCLLVLLLAMPMLARADDEQSIHSLIDGFHEAASRSDFDDYFARFAQNAYFLGTDAAERWSVAEFKDYAKPAFDAGRGWTYKVESRSLESGPDDNTLWFDEILVNKMLGRCRGTGVVVRENGQWKIAHYSLTLLIPNDIADAVGEQSMQADGILP